MPTLRPQLERARRETAFALTIVSKLAEPGSHSIPSHYIAELVLLRMFALLESALEESACRLICGARYCDGYAPQLLRHRPVRGLEKARAEMREYNRATPMNRLRWTRARDIAENLEKLLPRNEHFVTTVLNHGVHISDMRKIRNHIAHRNAETRKRFQDVIYQHYGARVPGLTPGKFLVSSRFSPSILEQMCRQTQIVIRAAIRG